MSFLPHYALYTFFQRRRWSSRIGFDPGLLSFLPSPSSFYPSISYHPAKTIGSFLSPQIQVPLLCGLSSFWFFLLPIFHPKQTCPNGFPGEFWNRIPLYPVLSSPGPFALSMVPPINSPPPRQLPTAVFWKTSSYYSHPNPPSLDMSPFELRSELFPCLFPSVLLPCSKNVLQTACSIRRAQSFSPCMIVAFGNLNEAPPTIFPLLARPHSMNP